MSVDPLSGFSQLPTAGSNASLQDVASGFEELLMRQLTQSLVDTTGGGDATDGSSTDDVTGGDGTDATTSLLQSYLPDALAQSVQSAGGLGLASSLAQSMGGGVA